MNLKKGVKGVVFLRSTSPAHQCASASRRNQKHNSAGLVRDGFTIQRQSSPQARRLTI